MQAWRDAAVAAADAARVAVLPYFRAGILADLKPDESPVTVADRAAEMAIRAVLGTAFPEYGILGEEFAETNAGARHVWVVDPIDGTRAFITGRPSFCTLIALLEDGVPVLGVIDQPVSGERWIGGKDFSTVFSGGAGRIGPRDVTDLAAAELSATAPEMFRSRLARFESLQARCRRVYWGGDAYAYGLLALGQIDIVAECGMSPWDWAALVPVVEAAGGVITDWAGQALRLDSDRSVLAAANPALHAAALAVLR